MRRGQSRRSRCGGGRVGGDAEGAESEE
jgi:hypothetical protein